MRNFEVLDARIASALNKIIHNSHFKRKISLEERKAQKEDRFLRGGQIAYLIHDHFRVIGANDSVENCVDLFTISFRNGDIKIVKELREKFDLARNDHNSPFAHLVCCMDPLRLTVHKIYPHAPTKLPRCNSYCVH